ncbi:MAG: alpha/beta hydrolase [Balneolaceae bacterium]|nr:alpha/beta hydrolase [Balneolaceae bacterium]
MFPKSLWQFLLLPVCIFLVLLSCEEKEPQAEIRSQEGIEEINGTEIFYKRMGEGEPVIIVHGGPVLDHGYLVPYFAPLAEDYELIYYDQRLSGRSSAEVDSVDITMANFVEDIEELRKEMDVGKVHLMAHSWGGLLAMKYAIKYPSNLNSLILLNSMPASTDLWQKETQLVAQNVSSKDSLKRQEIMSSDLFQTDPQKAIEQLLILSFRSQFEDPSLADSLDFYIPEDYMMRSQQFGNLMADLMNYDLHSDLEDLQVPTLLIYGGSEPAATISGSELDTIIPNSELVLMQNSGHFPFIEQPEDFLAVIQDFLEAN